MGRIECQLRDDSGAGGPYVRWRLSGTFDAEDRGRLRDALRVWSRAGPRDAERPGVLLDLSGVDDISEFGRLAIVEQLDAVKAAGAPVFFRPRPTPWRWAIGRLWVHLRRVAESGERDREPRPVTGLIEAFGASVLGHAAGVRQVGVFVGEVVRWTFSTLLFARSRPSLFWPVALRVGVDALPILTVLSFLIGIVLANQGARQLADFGASVFVADLVTIAFVREMGPLVTAILVAGRTGSAYTASLASMQDSEELHALQMMGHHPIGFLVVPRVLAAVTCMPILVLWAMFVGLFGAFVYSTAALDLRSLEFCSRAIGAVGPWDFLMALLKSLTFGAIIALVGCYKGLQEVKGADEVGRQTTASVVWCIFLVIVASAGWTVLFSVVDR